jgi:hypothetical protein
MRWWLALMTGIATLPACDRPCKTLASRLCENAGSEEACAEWQARVDRVSSETCVAGLKALDRERLAK